MAWSKRDGEKLKAALQDAGVTQQQAADHYEVTRRTVSYWLAGNGPKSPLIEQQLRDIIAGNPPWLLKPDGSKVVDIGLADLRATISHMRNEIAELQELVAKKFTYPQSKESSAVNRITDKNTQLVDRTQNLSKNLSTMLDTIQTYREPAEEEGGYHMCSFKLTRATKDALHGQSKAMGISQSALLRAILRELLLKD